MIVVYKYFANSFRFLIHRVELKEVYSKLSQFDFPSVSNSPCGVERSFLTLSSTGKSSF